MFFRLFATYCNGDAEDLKANLKKSIVDKIPHIKILRRHLTFFAWRGMIYNNFGETVISTIDRVFPKQMF